VACRSDADCCDLRTGIEWEKRRCKVFKSRTKQSLLGICARHIKGALVGKGIHSAVVVQQEGQWASRAHLVSKYEVVLHQ